MQQQNLVMVDKVVMLGSATVPSSLLPFAHSSKVNRTRKVLLLLIGVLLMLCSINLFVVVYTYFTSNLLVEQSANSSSQFVSVLISIIYYVFGFFATYRSYHTSLLVFAWLGLASFLLMLAVVIVILIGIIVTTSHLGFVKGILVGIVFIVICLTAGLLQIIAVRYAFIFSNLLKDIKQASIEQL